MPCIEIVKQCLFVHIFSQFASIAQLYLKGEYDRYATYIYIYIAIYGLNMYFDLLKLCIHDTKVECTVFITQV